MIRKLLFLLCLYTTQTTALEIALTFDDAPGSDSAIFTGKQRTAKIINILREKNIKEVAFFCNTQSFDENIRSRLLDYAQAGHIIANHTAMHLDLGGKDISVQQFIDNIMIADKNLKTIPNFHRWFRYPYLRQMAVDEKSNNIVVQDFLKKYYYRQGYVTIETYDWYLSSLFEKAASDAFLDYDKVKKVYLEMLWDGIIFYDKLSQKILGYSPKHIILLHENDLNAMFIGDLIDYIQAKGGHIISVSQAYSDPISNPQYDALPYSQRRIRALAKYLGYKGELVSKYEEEKNIDKLYQDAFNNN